MKKIDIRARDPKFFELLAKGIKDTLANSSPEDCEPLLKACKDLNLNYLVKAALRLRDNSDDK